jgi:hypothetical protein
MDIYVMYFLLYVYTYISVFMSTDVYAYDIYRNVEGQNFLIVKPGK